MRLRFRGSFLLFFFFVGTSEARFRVKLEPGESDEADSEKEEGGNVLSHRILDISMYNPNIQTAIADPPFAKTHGNVSVPATRRSRSANVSQRSATSRNASAIRSRMCSTCASDNLIHTEATSAFPQTVKSSTPRGIS